MKASFKIDDLREEDENMELAIKQMKPKKSYGSDLIPMILVRDLYPEMTDMLLILFNKIYESKIIPEKWKIARIIPLHKKGPINDISNYRPISNICSLGKLFERMLLMRLQQLDINFRLNLTGESQHGFKSNHSTITACLELQSKISDKLDNNEYVAVTSFDMSAAFDVVNRELLIKRMKLAGIPLDIVEILQAWFKDRTFFVEINGHKSKLKQNDFGTIQGSVLGPVLYSIFVRPIFDLINLLTFADDNYLIEHDKDLMATIGKVKFKAEFLLNWLTNSGLIINAAKTEICIFSSEAIGSFEVEILDFRVKTKSSIKVLGLLFDSKLQWNLHIDTCIAKAKKSKGETKEILSKEYFTSRPRSL